MATLIIFLFSVLSSLLWGSSAQTSVIIFNSSRSISMTSTIFYLNSSQPSTWSNDHSINQTVDFSDGSRARLVLSRDPITCGFFCTETCNSYLFSVVVRGESKIRTPQVSFPGLVWSANRDYPVGENATLKLTRHEGLVLRDSDDTKVWSTNISGNSVMGMNITDSGNLVLFNDEGAMVWQSFDHPADSLCIGQSLHEGQKLIASAPGANWSHGSYYATFTSSAGFAAFIEAGQPLMYFQLVPNQSPRNSGKTNYTIFERGYGLVVKSGNLQAQAGSLVIYFPLDSYFQHIRLDSDGQLRIYQYRTGDEWRVLSDLVAEKLGECQYPRRCGDYGVCREAQCSCPEGKDGMQYFKQTQVQLPELGCSRITPLSCKPSLDQHRLLEVENVTYFNLIDSDAAFPGYKDIDGCKQACLQNCSCSAVFFKYESNASNGHCYLPSEILSIRGGKMPNYNFTSTAFIKVQIPYMAPSPLPIEGPTSGVSPPSPPSKNRLNLVAIIAGSSAGALVIVCLLIIFYFVNLRKNTVEDEGEDYIKQMAGVPMRFSYENLRVATEDFKEKLDMQSHGEEAVRMIRIAAWCLQDDHTRRPLMSVVVKVLEGVMEVDPNIIYRFSNAMAPPSVADDPISTAPQASVLSAPR
ncbi:hypothetical protein HHK36_003617 [Tetracentron sinense]|uniref:Bulb-type lectin domain-containing protein n=1 Tax=Tetracentron sinense TaxID=13715 RepID=A0A835DP51_TETSI|nr:hypothetical protein HHK36_003617 [Tetracentron sinense]